VEQSIKKSLQAVVALVLVMAMQLPVAAKIYHSVFVHVDTECKDYSSLHVHETEFKCEFQKYKLSTNYILPDLQKTVEEFLMVRESKFSIYSSLSQYQKLHFSLRGPPSFS